MPPSRRPVPWHALELRHGALTLRALRTSDGRDWAEVRRRNQEWLREWEATRPPEDAVRGVTFRSMVRDLRRQAREGRCLPFALLVNGSFAGQITVSSIVGGSAQFANVGYWIDQRHAGQGYTPLAVALVTDHCWFGLGLHRMEVAIRPENVASLRVVEKLGFTEVGYAPKYLHINGAWRDHRLFALTVEEVPGGLLRRLLDQQQA